ncbi:hypothetical protein INR49_019488 [Caranx melampygus]|nr:hypothetical protein INR49_019488 [Caranx melampygus]
MTEPAESGAVVGAVEPVEFGAAAEKLETSLEETFENTLEISQDVEAAGVADGLTEEPPAPETPTTEPKWEVGSQCRAVWSEDGQLYPATVLCLDGQRCRVRFDRYDNEEDVELSALQWPTATPPHTQRRSAQSWCSVSGRVLRGRPGVPAVVLWVKGQRCRIRFDNYNNEEELDVGGLLHPDELLGAGRASTKFVFDPHHILQGNSWKTFDLRRARREEERRVKERQSKEREEKKRGHLQRDEAEKPTNHSFSLFPPFPPPPQSSSGDPLSFVAPPPPPPPPPLWMFGGKESDSASSMLMLWYMCGFHTGSFMAQQLARSSTSKD